MMNNNIIFYDNNACVRRTSISHLNVVYRPQDIKSNYHGFLYYLLGKTSSLEVHENYFILSSLPPDTEFTFQVNKKIPQFVLIHRMSTNCVVPTVWHKLCGIPTGWVPQANNLSIFLLYICLKGVCSDKQGMRRSSRSNNSCWWSRLSRKNNWILMSYPMILVKNWWLFNNSNLIKELFG